jgi:diguanylate cyclase (GGDEF)-like protein/PAS domain S-box-containing protein
MTATPALRIAVAYVVFASAWIAFSDLLVRHLVRLFPGDPVETLTRLQLAKGWFFVVVTGLLLFGALRVTFLRLLREQRAHHHAEARTLELLANLPHGVEEIDREGVITYVNPARAVMLGFTPAELIGRRLWEVIPPSSRPAFELYFHRLTAQTPKPSSWEGPNLRRDGTVIRVRADWSYLSTADGAVRGFSAVVTDVTAQRHAEEGVAEAAAVFETASEAIVLADAEGRIRRTNHAFTALTGIAQRDAIRNSAAIVHPSLPGGRPLSEITGALATQGRWQGEITIATPKAEVIPGWVSVSASNNVPDSAYYVVLFTDLRALKESQRRLEQATYYDALTGLPNRALFEAHVAHALDRVRDSTRRVVVLALNIDRFKEVNQSLGPAAGDVILRQLGHRLRAALNVADTVARVGGDRFMILLEEPAPNNEVTATAERLLAAARAPFAVDGSDVFCTVSIGIALSPTDGVDAATLARNAETAVYRARDTGGNAWQFYSASFTARAFERWTMETHLRRAVERGELLLHYQPQITRDGKLVACEALVRWNHPEFGLVPPERFIALAEETGLIAGIGEWVLTESCRQAHAWEEQGLHLRVAVNISSSEFSRPDLVQNVTRATAGRVPPEQLELEITESVFMRRTDATIANLTALRNLGFCLAIDDFGTGYSSLSYLQRFPVHRLKVDQSFVRGVPGNHSDAAIVRAVVALGHSLRLQVIAEGVESEEQSAFLASADCDEFQGFRFSPPLAADAFYAWARSREAGGSGV